MPQSKSAERRPPARSNPLRYGLLRSTASLLFLLEGMESVREFRRAILEDSPAVLLGPGGPRRIYPLLSYVDVLLTLENGLVQARELLLRDGGAEQLAFRGWLDRVQFLLERHRGSGRGGPLDAVVAGLLGDIHLLRRDLDDHGGVATLEGSGSCSTLMWFAADEPIIFGIGHVFDLLNQLGLMTGEPADRGLGSAAGWTALPLLEELLADAPVPELVSLRSSLPATGAAPAEPQRISLVFANGVFLEMTLTMPDGGELIGAQPLPQTTVRINEQGDLQYADGTVVPRAVVYRAALQAMQHQHPTPRDRELLNSGRPDEELAPS